MKTVNIYLESMDRIKEFENEIGRFECKFEIVSGGFIADAKSIMALFALDLSKAQELRIQSNDAAMIEKIVKAIERFTKPVTV